MTRISDFKTFIFYLQPFMYPYPHSTLPWVWRTWSSVLPISGSTPGSLEKLDSSSPTLQHVECLPSPYSNVLSLVLSTLELYKSAVEPDQGCTGGGRLVRCSFFTSHIFERHDTTLPTSTNGRAQNLAPITIKLCRLVYKLVNITSLNFQDISFTYSEARNEFSLSNCHTSYRLYS